MIRESYAKILVPFDNSKYSRKALRIAIAIAKAYGSSLHIATILDISSVNPPGLIRSKDVQKTLGYIVKRARDSSEAVLNTIRRDCNKIGIKARTYVIEGVATDELLKIQANGCDLIVIGAKGLSGFSKLKTIGSVSRKISELATCPVILVH